MSHLLVVELYPVLQLLGDVLVLPFSQVGDYDARVEGAGAGLHRQLLNRFLLEVQKT